MRFRLLFASARSGGSEEEDCGSKSTSCFSGEDSRASNKAGAFLL